MSERCFSRTRDEDTGDLGVEEMGVDNRTGHCLRGRSGAAMRRRAGGGFLARPVRHYNQHPLPRCLGGRPGLPKRNRGTNTEALMAASYSTENTTPEPWKD